MNNEEYFRQAPAIVAAIHDAIAEAAKQGERLESVFFGGRFAEMGCKPSMAYMVECRGDENVVVGGELTFKPKATGTVLIVSERAIILYGADGLQAADCPILGPGDIQEEQRVVSDAVVEFFARCYAKRM